MMNIGNKGSQYHDQKPPPCCAITISVRFSEPTHINTVMITKPIATS